MESKNYSHETYYVILLQNKIIHIVNGVWQQSHVHNLYLDHNV